MLKMPTAEEGIRVGLMAINAIDVIRGGVSKFG